MPKDDLLSMITDLIAIFESGNLDEFIKVVESEALTLHDDDFDAVFHFNETNTLQIINAIWKFRNDTKTPVCFTLDAGQMSMFYIPKTIAKKVLQFIKDELVGFCQNGQYICDEIGNGSIQLV
jgi:diphosphomevalonate decarboxylase